MSFAHVPTSEGPQERFSFWWRCKPTPEGTRQKTHKLLSSCDLLCQVARSHHKHRVAWDSYVEFLEEGWKAEAGSQQLGTHSLSSTLNFLGFWPCGNSTVFSFNPLSEFHFQLVGCVCLFFSLWEPNSFWLQAHSLK